MSAEERRRRYAETLRKLSEFFPNQCDEKTKALYFERVIKLDPHPDDFDEAGERVISSRESRAFPPWSAIDERLRDIAKSHRGYEYGKEDRDAGPRFDNSPEGILASQEVFRAARAMDMPEREPDIRTDRKARQKHLGITQLTQAQNDDLDRKQRERERKRQQDSEPKPPLAEDGGAF
jgi:hypothetical protein